jgi:hypothetical protein
MIFQLDLLIAYTIALMITVNTVTATLSSMQQRVTKVEMSGIVQQILLYEGENDTPPATLQDLAPYIQGGGYKKDAWGTAYTYDDSTRELCSVNDSWGTAPANKYCKGF